MMYPSSIMYYSLCIYQYIKLFYPSLAKKPDRSDKLRFRRWEKEHAFFLDTFQAKWFEVAMRERGSEFTSFGGLSDGEECLKTERKSSSGSSAHGE